MLIFVICISLSKCLPLPEDGAANTQTDKLFDQAIEDESGQDDLYSDDEYQTDTASPTKTTPLSATSSSNQSGSKTVTGPSRPVTLGRHTSPSELISISKTANVSSAKLTGQTPVTNLSVRTGKTIQPVRFPSVISDQLDELDSAEDYSTEITQPGIDNVSQRGKKPANSKDKDETTSHVQISKTNPANITKTSTQSSSQSGNTSPRQPSNVESAAIEESGLNQMNGKPSERGPARNQNVTSARLAAVQHKVPLEAPKTTFSPVMIAQTMTSSISQTTTLPIEVEQSNTAAFQQAQQPSITASPHAPAATPGQQVDFAHSTVNPTFTHTSTFTQPVAPPVAGFPPSPHWPGSPAAQSFMTQPAFVTADFSQAMRQEDRVQQALSNLPQHSVPAHVAFQHSHVASQQQQMAAGAGTVTQQLPAQAATPSGVANSQPVGTAVGQPIWIRTKNGLSQANLLPVSVLSQFIPTFKSTGIRIVPPTLIKTESS